MTGRTGGTRGGRSRRGPRFTGETREATAGRMRAAAVAIVEAKGVAGLTLRAVAEAPGVGVTATAPLHYFGTAGGLVAAVAASGWEALALRLRGARPAAGGAGLGQLAQAYAGWAFERPRLYEAMHAAPLWRALVERGPGGSARSARANEVARGWLERSTRGRGAVFATFVAAAQAPPRPGPALRGPPGLVAHVVTTLVDGFLFQVFDEGVGAGWDVRSCLQHLARMTDLVLADASGGRAADGVARVASVAGSE